MKLLLGLFLCLSTAMANASIVTYRFSGIFDYQYRFSLGESGSEAEMLDLIKIGDRFSGTVTFDNAGTGVESTELPLATYPLLGFEMRLPGRFNDIAASWEPDFVSVYDDKRSNEDSMLIYASMGLDPLHAFSVMLSMAASTSTAFDGFRVPDGFDDFVAAGLSLTLYHYDHPIFDSISGPATIALDNTAAAVPEPATGLLLMAGLAGAASLRRRR